MRRPRFAARCMLEREIAACVTTKAVHEVGARGRDGGCRADGWKPLLMNFAYNIARPRFT